MLALLIGQTRIRFQIRQGDRTAACKRIGRTDKYIRFCHKKPRKFEVVFPQRLADHRLVKTVQIQHANLAPKLRHILNQLIRLRLADTEIVLFSAVLADQIDKRLNGKGIVLGGNTELAFLRHSAKIALLDQVCLLDHLSRIPQKFFPVRGNHHALVRAGKQGKSNLMLQFLDRRREARLCNIKFFCRPADGSGCRHLHHVF